MSRSARSEPLRRLVTASESVRGALRPGDGGPFATMRGGGASGDAGAVRGVAGVAGVGVEARAGVGVAARGSGVGGVARAGAAARAAASSCSSREVAARTTASSCSSSASRDEHDEESSSDRDSPSGTRRLRPKSTSLRGAPGAADARSQFWGFKSRWQTPRACM